MKPVSERNDQRSPVQVRRLSEQQLRSVIAGVLSEAKGPDVLEASRAFDKTCRTLSMQTERLHTQLRQLADDFREIEEIGDMELLTPSISTLRTELRNEIRILLVLHEWIQRSGGVPQTIIDIKRTMRSYDKERRRGGSPTSFKHSPNPKKVR